MYCIVILSGPWTTSGRLAHGCGQQDFPIFLWSLWSRGQSNVVEIYLFGGEEAQHSSQISHLRTLSWSVTPWALSILLEILLLRSEIPSGTCAKLRTVAASNNRDYARNLSLRTLVVTFNRSHVNIGRATTSQSLLLLLAPATYTMVLFFTHIPFVVNHTINATPPERLQHYSLSYTHVSDRWWSKHLKPI